MNRGAGVGAAGAGAASASDYAYENHRTPPVVGGAGYGESNFGTSYAENRTLTRGTVGEPAGPDFRDSFPSSRFVRTNVETASHGFDTDVNTLNCYFDDIERFVARVQSAVAAQREIDILRRQRGSRKAYPGDGLLHTRAQLPAEAEFVDIFTKFKHCFNILGKLQHHIYDPPASELLHYLFSPLNVIMDVSQWALNKFLPPQISYPSISREASLLLQRSLTQREYDIWNSLGDTWKHMPEIRNGTLSNRFPGGPANPYPSMFRNKYKGILHHGYSTSDIDRIRTPEEIDAESRQLADKERYLREKEEMLSRLERRLNEEQESIRDTFEKISLNQDSVGTVPVPPFAGRGTQRSQSSQRGGLNSGGGYSPSAFQKQKAYYDELKYKRAKIAFALHDRVGENSKELTITKGEYLEVVDDSRNWWQCRNINNRVGFVPHTILSNIFDAELEPRRKLSLQQPISVAVPPQNVSAESEHSSTYYPRDNFSHREVDDRKYPGYTDRTLKRNDVRY